MVQRAAVLPSAGAFGERVTHQVVEGERPEGCAGKRLCPPPSTVVLHAEQIEHGGAVLASEGAWVSEQQHAVEQLHQTLPDST